MPAIKFPSYKARQISTTNHLERFSGSICAVNSPTNDAYRLWPAATSGVRVGRHISVHETGSAKDVEHQPSKRSSSHSLGIGYGVALVAPFRRSEIQT